MNDIKRVAVFCGSYSGSEAYESVAYDLGKSLAEKGINLVYGGGNRGLMGAVARGCKENGGTVFGVIPKFLADLKPVEVGINETELIVTDDMHSRKKKMAELSDAFIALPGGIGTFEEIFEQITWLQLHLHKKPCGFLNVNGFYDKLCDFLRNAVSEGFMQSELFESLSFDSAPEALIESLKNTTVDIPSKFRH